MTKENTNIVKISRVERAKKIAQFIKACEKAGISVAQNACLIESGDKVYLLAHQNNEYDNESSAFLQA